LVARGRPRKIDLPEHLRAELRLILNDVNGDLDDVLRHAHPKPASLHRLHRDLRRLTTALRIWQELLGTVGQAQIRPLVVRVRRLARLVGQVRDRDVALDILEGVGPHASNDEEAEELRQYRSRLQDDARMGRELLRAFLRSERNANLFENVGDTFSLRPRRLRAAELKRVLIENQQRGHKRVVSAHRKARRRASMNRLHRLRIRVRRLRQMSDLARAIDPAHDPTLAESLRRLQQRLGHLHDLDVLLHDLDPGLRESGWAAALRKERRRQRKRIEKSLDARRPPKPEEAEPRPVVATAVA
jgi:CHAD domain-containing protein